MKRVITLLLALLMVMSLVACGNQTNTEESSTTNEQTESTTLDSEETGTTEEITELEETKPSTEPETESSTESVEETPTFDTSWAGDKYVMPIPAPPVSDLQIDEFVGRSGGNAIQVAAQDVQNLTNDEIAAYRQTLETLGFSNNIYEKDFDSEHGYEFSAFNENEDYVYLNYYSDYFILIFEFAE